ncbi:PHP domain-containing protein [bacterium]|nr:PHP domain-containing protein [bacterium]
MIENFTKEDYCSKVNLHIHSCFSDGKCQPEELIAQAKEKGLKFIAISDHNTVDAYLNTDIQKDPMVIPAVEFDCWCSGVFYHLLAYEIDVTHEALKPFLAKTKRETQADWIRIFSFNRHPKKLFKAIHEAGGKAVLAHPACCTTFNLDGFVKKLVKYGLDGMEVYYPYSMRLSKLFRCANDEKINRIAEKYNLIKTGGIDCHGNLY